ncbi:MAG: hypothetical protein A3F91_09325 [Flavobacteria bacterium RIFCSPLOWO2_12_FULL_35_11]|nr:MAG: hypothetical protein A3F91_09325 [Flavobacteria bacterium RIFCSPLOWO2_12_FULL_35_11]
MKVTGGITCAANETPIVIAGATTGCYKTTCEPGLYAYTAAVDRCSAQGYHLPDWGDFGISIYDRIMIAPTPIPDCGSFTRMGDDTHTVWNGSSSTYGTYSGFFDNSDFAVRCVR